MRKSAIVFIVIRLMGKKELSKVQPFELAIIILIADLASAPMSSRAISIFDGIIPIVTLLIAYIIFTLIIQSSNKAQEVVCGTISPIIKDGKILEDEFKRLQYTIPDLMSQLRECNVFKIQDVKYAIVETNGNLSVITKDEKINQLPLNIIEDGKISDINIKILNIEKSEVDNMLKKENIKMEDILVGTLDENSKFIYQLKEVENK